MFLHCLRCNTGLGHEAENLPHDAQMTDDGPLCGECGTHLLNAALPMYEALRAVQHDSPSVHSDAVWHQLNAAIALAQREGAPAPGAEEQPYDAGGESPTYRAHMIDAGRGAMLR